jgi:DNA polymerase IV
MPRATAQTRPIVNTARGLLAEALPMIKEQGLTLVGITLGNLEDERAVQLTLPFGRNADGSLDATLDDLHDRFGSGVVTRAVLLGRDQGLAVPLLPD